jgi:hypothetical protein
MDLSNDVITTLKIVKGRPGFDLVELGRTCQWAMKKRNLIDGQDTK